MRVKKKVKKTFLIILTIVLVVALLVGGYFVYKRFSNTPATNGTKVINEVKEYGYYLEDDSTKLYKKLFDELSNVLNAEEVNEEEYAKLVAQMLVADFYNLDNKMSKNDIGGTQFILDSYVENFVLEASETVYKYIEHNIYGDRKQTLPVVEEVTVESVRTNSYTYKKLKDDNAYIVTVGVTYKKDLGYPEKVVVKMLHNEEKLEVFYIK